MLQDIKIIISLFITSIFDCISPNVQRNYTLRSSSLSDNEYVVIHMNKKY